MFTLVDGRNELYQWDLNRQIAVNDADVTEVHFCNRTDDCSLVVEVKNGVANIPNILLQETWDIRVYAYCTEYTKIEERFKVKARTKPSDYIYTETEVKTIEAIEQRINDLEASFGDNIDEAIREYIEENPIEIDLSNIAEKDHKHTIADITDYEEPDLSEYAKKNDIPSLNGYATEKYVDDAVANLDIPEVDLDGYATENWVKNQGYINSISEEYITDIELTAKGYASKDDLSIYAKKSDIPDVSDFITSIPAEYITEDELNAKGYLTKHQSLAGYATEKYVDDAIAAIDIPESGGSVSAGETLYRHNVHLYYSMNDKTINAYCDFISTRETAITDTADFANILTSDFNGRIGAHGLHSYTNNSSSYKDPVVYIAYNTSTPTMITVAYQDCGADSSSSVSKGLVKEIETKLTNFTTSDVVVEVAETVASGGGDVDLSDYAKKSDIPDVSEFISEIPEEYVTEEELSKKGYLTQHQDISGKADKVHEHSISDITDYTAPDLSGYATIKYVDAAIANVDIPGGVAASQVVYLDFSYYYEYDPLIENVVVPDEQESIFNQIVAGKKLAIYVKNDVEYLPTGFTYGENSIVFYYHESAIFSVTDKKYLFAWKCKAVRNVDTGVWKITITDESIGAIATESYVQSQIRKAQLGGDVDLSEYAKKEDIPDVSDFLSEIPAEYITETELNNKGYQTEAQVTDLINEALGVIENGSY